MIIILEGPRCSGKSTAAQRLLELGQSRGVKTEIWKSERGNDPWDDMKHAVLDFAFGDWATRLDNLLIVDRFHVTEFVMYHVRNGLDPVSYHSTEIPIGDTGETLKAGIMLVQPEDEQLREFMGMNSLLDQLFAFTVVLLPPWDDIERWYSRLETSRPMDGSFRYSLWGAMEGFEQKFDNFLVVTNPDYSGFYKKIEQMLDQGIEAHADDEN